MQVEIISSNASFVYQCLLKTISSGFSSDSYSLTAASLNNFSASLLKTYTSDLQKG